MRITFDFLISGTFDYIPSDNREKDDIYTAYITDENGKQTQAVIRIYDFMIITKTKDDCMAITNALLQSKTLDFKIVGTNHPEYSYTFTIESDNFKEVYNKIEFDSESTE